MERNNSFVNLFSPKENKGPANKSYVQIAMGFGRTLQQGYQFTVGFCKTFKNEKEKEKYMGDYLCF